MRTPKQHSARRFQFAFRPPSVRRSRPTPTAPAKAGWLSTDLAILLIATFSPAILFQRSALRMEAPVAWCGAGAPAPSR
ncbi:MAG: hypothetical protein JF885_05555 [Candidatus Dormibacteraeota bacterium]|nr:hypothetical protein [Candidatus Dormibacteraeota bacterium]